MGQARGIRSPPGRMALQKRDQLHPMVCPRKEQLLVPRNKMFPVRQANRSRRKRVHQQQRKVVWHRLRVIPPILGMRAHRTKPLTRSWYLTLPREHSKQSRERSQSSLNRPHQSLHKALRAAWRQGHMIQQPVRLCRLSHSLQGRLHREILLQVEVSR